MSTGTVVANLTWLEPSLEDPTILEQVFHCRCGAVHRGKMGREEYRNHECFHRQLKVIDATDAGEFVVYCGACETAWIAPCVAEGVSLNISNSAMSRGCEWCRQYVFAKLKEKPEALRYECPKCKELWDLHAEER